MLTLFLDEESTASLPVSEEKVELAEAVPKLAEIFHISDLEKLADFIRNVVELLVRHPNYDRSLPKKTKNALYRMDPVALSNLQAVLEVFPRQGRGQIAKLGFGLSTYGGLPDSKTKYVEVPKNLVPIKVLMLKEVVVGEKPGWLPISKVIDSFRKQKIRPRGQKPRAISLKDFRFESRNATEPVKRKSVKNEIKNLINSFLIS